MLFGWSGDFRGVVRVGNVVLGARLLASVEIGAIGLICGGFLSFWDGNCSSKWCRSVELVFLLTTWMSSIVAEFSVLVCWKMF